MAYDKKPSTWLGAGLSVASHKLLLPTNDVAQVETVLINKTAAQLANKWFKLYDGAAATVAVWFNLDSGGVEPSHGCTRALAVAVTTGDADTVIAAALAAILEADSKFTATAGGTATATITHSDAGWYGSIVDGDSGLTLLQTMSAALPRLTDAEADPASGDAVQIAEAICEALYQHYNGLATADKPTHIRIFRSTQTDDSTGVVTRTYTVQIDGTGDFTPTTG